MVYARVGDTIPSVKGTGTTSVNGYWSVHSVHHVLIV